MHHSFWLQRWQENRIGFHLDTTNPYLSKLGQPENSHVLCPYVVKVMTYTIFINRDIESLVMNQVASR